MPDDELIRSFVVRQRDLAAILETVHENTGASNQHLLILGPRGMGKTTLINRAVAEIRRTPELNERWYPILFDEESYTVTSAGELWFQALSHLADQTKDPEMERARRALQTVTDRARLRDSSLARLLEFADAQHKRLLLTFENVDMLFDDQMGEGDGWDVRHTLQNEPRLMVLATSTTRLDSFHDSKKPLYELFREHTLERLDIEECRTVWKLVTDAELPSNQARPIQIFTGGNTRLLTILAAFAKDRSFRELMDDLVGLIDDNTSYFKHNIEALPSESRKIFVTLADLWSPATSRQVADQTRGDIRAVSAQLGRLASQGVVEIVRLVDRTQMFQVAERMYNLYYLLRRRGSGRVRAVVEFIVRYYDRDGMQRMLTSIADEACGLTPGRRDDNIQAYAEILRRIPDSASRLAALQGAPAPFLALPDVAEQLSTIESSEPKTKPGSEPQLRRRVAEDPFDVAATCQLVDLLFARGAPDQAIEVMAPAITIGHTPNPLRERFARALSTYRRDADPSDLPLRRAIEAASEANLACAYPFLTGALLESNVFTTLEVREIANESLERWPNNTMTAAVVGAVFRILDDQAAADAAFRHALELDPTNIIAAWQHANILIEMADFEAAATHVLQFLAIRPERPEFRLLLSYILTSLQDPPEIILKELEKAKQCVPTHRALLLEIGDLELRLERFGAAEATYRRLLGEPGDDLAVLGLIQSLLLQGKLTDARAVLGPDRAASPDYQVAAALVDRAEHSPHSARRRLRSAGMLPLPDPRALSLILGLQLLLRDSTGARATVHHYLAGSQGLRGDRLSEVSVLVLNQQFTALYPDLVDWTRELVTAVPTAEANLLHAHALAFSAAWADLWGPLAAVLADASFTGRKLPCIINIASRAAACGHAARVLDTLATSPSAPHFEPLLVALRRLAGEPTNPPQEVGEVADDIVRDIERLRYALSAAPPAPSRAASPEHQTARKARKRSRRTTAS